MADTTRTAAVAELRSHEVHDEIQQEALAQACDALSKSEIASTLDELELVVVDPARASKALAASPYFTHSFAALLHESMIVVNLDFLAEVEAALRSFAIAGSFYGMPQLCSDEALFDLVGKLRPDPWPHLIRVRRLTSGYGAPTREGDREDDVRQELALVILFFAAHEVGHLLDGKDERGFGSVLPPGAPLEHRAANAVVRLARHVDDLVRRGHGLPGFETLSDPTAEVRTSIERMAVELGDLPAHHDEYFADEHTADEWGYQIIEEHLECVSAQDAHAGAMATYLVSRGVFAAALYGWHADLKAFCHGVGIGHLTNAQSLSFAMMRDRENYVRAASLFGPVHRNTLTRGENFLESILQTRTDWFPECKWSRSTIDASGPEQDGAVAQEKWWVEETVLRFSLLGTIAPPVHEPTFARSAL